MEIDDDDGIIAPERRIGLRKLKPLVRRRGQLILTKAGRTAKIQVQKDMMVADTALWRRDEKEQYIKEMNEERATKDKEMKTELAHAEFIVEMVQFGSKFSINCSRRLLEILAWYKTELEIFITTRKTKAKMKELQDDLEDGEFEKLEAKVISVGVIDKTKFRKSVPGAQEELVNFELDSSYPTLMTSQNWTGIVIGKRADTKPQTPDITIMMHCQMVAPKDGDVTKKSKKKKGDDRQMSHIWEKGMTFVEIRKMVEPRLKFYDRNKDGMINYELFQEAMRNLGVFVSDARLTRLYRACETNEEGLMKLEELTIALCINDRMLEKQFLSPRDVFELFDYDGSGDMSFAEFSEAIQSIASYPVPMKETTKAFTRYGTNVDGDLDLESFTKIWLDYCDVDYEIKIRQKLLKIRGGGLVSFSKKKRLAKLVQMEQTLEDKMFAQACESVKEEQRNLRIEQDIERKERRAEMKQQYVAKKEIVSTTNKTIQQQQKNEIYEHKRIMERETVLLNKLREDANVKEALEKKDREDDRAMIAEQERIQRAKRGDDRLQMGDNPNLRQIPEKLYKTGEGQEKLLHAVLMDFSNTRIRELPPRGFLFWCESLRSLNISNSNLHTLTTEIGELASLEYLNLRHNSLQELPSELGSLKSLLVLDVAQNKLKTLPSAIGELKKLESFFAEKNILESIPKEIGDLSNLLILNLALNHLKEIPTTIGNLKTLVQCDLSWNWLNLIPTEVCGLSSLQSLNVSRNELRRLPNALEGMMELQVLEGAHNQLVEIPPGIGKLPQLLKLDLSHNKIATIPQAIGGLRNLQVLLLVSNQLEGFPASMGRLESLLHLNVHDNCITVVCDELGACEELQDLDLSKNKLQGSLPESLGALHHLRRLNVADNRLDVLSDGLTLLPYLSELDASGNVLTRLPETIGELTTLEILRLSRNQLEQLPLEIGGCSRLLELDVSSNALRWLPSSLGIQMTSVRKLLLHHNLLRALPVEFANLLPTLEHFTIAHNPLCELPANARGRVDRLGVSSSGYSDAHVAAYLIEIANVHHYCIAVFDLLPNHKMPSLRDFVDMVREAMKIDSIWVDEMEVHVTQFYFITKNVGTPPRLEEMQEGDVAQREETIANRTTERNEMFQEVRKQELAIIAALDESYDANKTKLQYTQERLEARRKELLEERKRAEEEYLRTEFSKRWRKQEQICNQTESERRRENEENIKKWTTHFAEKRKEYTDSCLAQYGYHTFK